MDSVARPKLEEMRNKYKIFVGNPKGMMLFVRHRRREKNNIKAHIEEARCENVDWIQISRDRYGVKMWIGFKYLGIGAV
jgi:hypothetical protein